MAAASEIGSRESAASNSLREDLRQCTLDALIDAVTAPQMPESFLIPPLVLTHSICSSSIELFTSLVRRFLTPMGPGGAPDERAEFVIRTRVLVVLRTWVQQAPNDFRYQPALAQRLQQFLEKLIATESQANQASALLKAAKSIQDLYGKRMNEETATRTAKKIPTYPPLASSSPLEITSFPAKAIAEALTILDQPRFNAIEAHELLNVAWTGPEKERKAPGILAMIRWFNDVSAWALSEVVRHDQLKDRVDVLQRLIGVAHALYEMHSFSMMVAVMSGIRAFPSVRLHATWTEVARHKKSAQRFIELQELCSPHHAYRALRAAMDSALVTQVVPHLGVFLSSFVLLNEMPSVVSGSSPLVINFAKCYATYALIERLRAFQERGPTGLEPKLELLSYLSHYESISYADSLPLSQAIEPPPADGSNPPFPLLAGATAGGNVSMAMEMGESVMKRFGVIKKRLQEQKQVYINKTSTPQITFEELTNARPPRVIMEPGEAPVKWLSAKDKIAVCGGPADAVLRVMHIPTGECLSLIENCASPVMRYASGVFFHSTAAHLLVAVNLRDGETMTLAGHSDLITDVAVLPDARTVASASNDRTLVLWTLDMAPTTPLTNPVAVAAGSRVRAASKIAKKVTCAGHKGAVTCVVLYPRSSHGTFLAASGGADGTVRVWTKDGICLSTLIGHDSPLLSISLYGGSVLSVSRDGNLRQWDIEGGRLTRQLALAAAPLPGTPVHFAPDHAVFSSAPAGVLSVFNLTRLARTPYSFAQGYRATNFYISNSKVALVLEDGQVLVFPLDEPSAAPVLCPAALASVLDFTDEGMWVGASDGAVRLYDLEGREEKVLLSALAALPTRGLRSELMDEHLLAPPDTVGDARDSLTLPRRLLSLVTFERALLVYLTQSGPRLARAFAAQPASFSHLLSAHGAVTELQRDLVQSLTAALPSPDLETLYKSKVLDQTATFATYANAVAEFATYILNMGPPPDTSRPPAIVTIAEAAGCPSVSYFLRELALPLVEIASRGSLLPTGLAVKFEMFLTAEDGEGSDVAVQSLFQGARRASEAAATSPTIPILPVGGPPPPQLSPHSNSSPRQPQSALVSAAQKQTVSVNALQSAESDFLSTLSVATRRYRDAMAPRGWLTEKDIISLFAPAESIRNTHLLILSAFSLAAKQDVPLASALPVLFDHLPRYEEYVATVGPARRVYTFASSHAKFAEVFRSWSQEQAAQIGQTLQELLFETPLNRLALYTEHVETALQSATSATQPALLKLSVVLKRAPLWLQAKLDEASAADDNQLLQKVLSGTTPGFLSWNRRLLRRGLLTVQGKSRVVLLFNDTILICRQLKDWNLVQEYAVDLTQPGLNPALLPANRALEMNAQLQEAPAPKTILLLVGRTEEETVAWSLAIASAMERLQKSVFGVQLSHITDASGEPPKFVSQLLALLNRHMFVQNLFLQPAGAAQVKKVKALLNKALPDSLGAETWDAHLLAALVLEFLADLPDPVFDLQKMKKGDISVKSAEKLYENAPIAAKKLADAVIALVLKLLQQHETNRLNAHVLALVLGPAMIRAAAITDFASVADVSRSAAVFEALIELKGGPSASSSASPPTGVQPAPSSPSGSSAAAHAALYVSSPNVTKKALPVPPRRATLTEAPRPASPSLAVLVPALDPAAISSTPPSPTAAALDSPSSTSSLSLSASASQQKKPLPAPPPRRTVDRSPSSGLAASYSSGAVSSSASSQTTTTASVVPAATTAAPPKSITPPPTSSLEQPSPPASSSAELGLPMLLGPPPPAPPPSVPVEFEAAEAK